MFVGPGLVLLIVLAADVWVYSDAKHCAAEGSPVVLRMGGFTIDTPGAWLIGCLVLWIFFFPVYVAARTRG